MSKFAGVWASFEYLDETTEAIEKLREQGKQPQVLSPCPRHEIEHALGEPQTRLPFISLIFGALGCLTGYSFPAWTASDWILPVSGKPILAIPAFTIIGFELTILFTALFTLAGMIFFIALDTWRNPLPKGAKKYTRFQRDRFGVVVACEPSQTKNFEELLKNHGAEEVYVETH